MSVSELNHFMTYVIEGWMLFSAGFIGTTFVSFVSRRIQEDLEAAELAAVTPLAIAAAETAEVTIAETVDASVAEPVIAAMPTVATPQAANRPEPPTPEMPSGREGDELFAHETADGDGNASADDSARLDEVAAVSEQLAKNREKQADSSSVSVST